MSSGVYEDFKYLRLARPDSIRVVVLHPEKQEPLPDNQFCDLSIEIVPCTLNEWQTPFYEALSYVWGTEPPSVSVVVKGGKPSIARVTPNLKSALERLQSDQK
jgi:hypothetical protein